MLDADWAHFFLPSKLRLEYDSLSKIGDWVPGIGERMLIFALNSPDENYRTAIGLVSESLKKHTNGPVLYDDISNRPTTDELDSAAYFVKQSRADTMVIIGSIDAINIGKAVSILASNQIFMNQLLQGSVEFTYDALPTIIIPLEPTMGEELMSSFVIPRTKAYKTYLCRS